MKINISQMTTYATTPQVRHLEKVSKKTKLKKQSEGFREEI